MHATSQHASIPAGGGLLGHVVAGGPLSFGGGPLSFGGGGPLSFGGGGPLSFGGGAPSFSGGGSVLAPSAVLASGEGGATAPSIDASCASSTY